MIKVIKHNNIEQTKNNILKEYKNAILNEGNTDSLTLKTEEAISALQAVRVAGFISELTNLVTKKGSKMIVFCLNDFHGKIDVCVFSSLYEQYVGLLQNNLVVAVDAQVNNDFGDISLIAKNIIILNKDDNE